MLEATFSLASWASFKIGSFGYNVVVLLFISTYFWKSHSCFPCLSSIWHQPDFCPDFCQDFCLDFSPDFGLNQSIWYWRFESALSRPFKVVIIHPKSFWLAESNISRFIWLQLMHSNCIFSSQRISPLYTFTAFLGVDFLN